MKEDQVPAARFIATMFSPVALILCPLGVALVLVISMTTVENVGTYLYFQTISICVYLFWGCLWYCKNRMEWFQKRSKLWTIVGMVSGPVLLGFLIHILIRERRSGENVPFISYVLFLLLASFCIGSSIYLYRAAKRDGVFSRGSETHEV